MRAAAVASNAEKIFAPGGARVLGGADSGDAAEAEEAAAAAAAAADDRGARAAKNAAAAAPVRTSRRYP